MASGLRQRVITALLLAGLVIGVLTLLPAGVAVAFIVVVLAAGAWEWAGFAGLESHRSRALYAAAVAVAVILAWHFTATPAALLGLLWATVAWWIAAFVWLIVAPERGGSRTAVVAGFLVLVPAAVGLGRLVVLEPDGRTLLLFLLVLIAAADVGAYFGGRSLGRHKLAPRVSPGKTWEGFAAGMLASGAAAAAGAALFDVAVGPWMAVTVLAALASVVGDLTESMFKRRVGLKDSSSLLPGHGGVLDRVDSLTAAGPVFLLGLHLLGVT